MTRELTPKELDELLKIKPKNQWFYDGDPLEEPNVSETTSTTGKNKTTQYKTSPNQLKATRKYEESIKQDKEKLERRNHQKNYSGAKSFITYEAKIEELHFMKSLIEVVLEWSEGIENFDTIKRPERKELYNNRHREQK